MINVASKASWHLTSSVAGRVFYAGSKKLTSHSSRWKSASFEELFARVKTIYRRVPSFRLRHTLPSWLR